MTTVYLDRKHLNLDIQGNTLVVSAESGDHSVFPLGLLSRVVVRGGNIAFKSNTLGTLAERGIDVVLLTGRHHQHAAHVMGAIHGNAQIRLAQCRAYHSLAFRLAFGANLVHRKLRRQQSAIVSHLERRPDLRKPLLDVGKQIENACNKLDGFKTIEAVMGIEGSAAAAYFSAFTLLFAPALGFEQRRRRPPPDPVNACLSLGYTLLHAEAVRASYSAGLDPYIGFLHAPYHGRESLAADLIEPLRPSLDSWVQHLFASEELRADHFSTGNGMCEMGKAGRQRFYLSYEQFARLPRRYLRLSARSLVHELKLFEPAWPAQQSRSIET